jgi:lysozyme family protein
MGEIATLFGRDAFAAAAHYEKLEARVADLEAALQQISEGSIPRPVETPYRADGQPSKHDICAHRMRMREECGECTAAFARAALKGNAPSPTEQA